MMFERPITRITAAALLVFAGACESGVTPPEDGQARVQIGFRAASPDASGSAASATAPPARVSAGQMEISGTNGTLTIDNVRFIVSEFELERDDDACEDAEGAEEEDDDACEEVERGPRFVELPLDGETALVVEEDVPAGTYEELEFEIEDVELDDDEDDDEARRIQELFAEIRSEFEDWPEEASLVVVGTFTPTDGEASDVRAYFEAEIEIEQEFDPPRALSENESITVMVDPGFWFRRPDGTVLDLSEFDFETMGRVLEFEVEMEDGFVGLEFDEDD